jgi:hypothetical protein
MNSRAYSKQVKVRGNEGPREDSAPPAASNGLPRKLLVAAGSLVIGLVAAEGFNRLRLNAAGRTYHAAGVRAELERESQNPDQLDGAAPDGKKDSLRVLNPYTGFDLLPALRQVQRDASYFSEPVAEEKFEILILGGSVANGFCRDASGRLIERLQEDSRFKGRSMRTLAYARPAFKQPQQLISLSVLLSMGLRPDAVINLDGFNEVAVANFNRKYDAHPLQPAIAQWSPHVLGLLDQPDVLDALLDLRLLRLRVDAVASRSSKSIFLSSSLYGNWALNRVRAMRGQQAKLQQELLNSMNGKDQSPVIKGPVFDGGIDEVMDFSVEAWKGCSLSIDAICRSRGIPYLHVLQPTLHAEGSKPQTAREVEIGVAPQRWMEAVEFGYPKLIEAGAELQAEGVVFLDATDIFRDVKETLYLDACHFNVAGQEMLADLVAESFLQHYP